MIYCIRNGYMLTEMTEAQFMASNPNQDIRPVSWQEAHQHVREHGCHETALWVDMDGRIRRAD